MTKIIYRIWAAAENGNWVPVPFTRAESAQEAFEKLTELLDAQDAHCPEDARFGGFQIRSQEMLKPQCQRPATDKFTVIKEVWRELDGTRRVVVH